MLDGAVKALPRQSVQGTHLEGKVSVVDQHIDGAELLFDRLHHTVDLILARYVGLRDQTLSAGRPHFRKNFLGSFFVLVIVNRDRGTGFCQADRCRRPDAAARPCDKNDLPVQRATDECAIHNSCIRLDRNSVFGGAFFILGGVVF